MQNGCLRFAIRHLHCMCFVFVASFFVNYCGAQVIPAERFIDWSNTGVPGGIPNRTVIYATINAVTYGNGTTDASGVINTAIANCPADQVVYLPARTYRLNNTIDLGSKSRITLRGAGMGKTILRPMEPTVAIATGDVGLGAERHVLGGSAKDSRSIVVDSVTGIAPGTLLYLYEGNDPDSSPDGQITAPIHRAQDGLPRLAASSY